MNKLLAGATLALIAVSAFGARAGASGSSAAYFTSAQATKGATLYAANCAQCHGAKLEGVSAPPLTGPAMKGSQSISDLYTYMATNMPAGRSGMLPSATYAAIFAYVLKENGHPAGKVALTPASAKKISAKI